MHWQYHFMTISTLHSKNIQIIFYFDLLDLIPFSHFFSQYFIELIHLNVFFIIF